MKFVSLTRPTPVPHQIHTYAELRQQIHHDLRIQHPEWVQPNGESPISDSYEVRLVELLDTLSRTDPTSLSLIFIAPLNRELEGNNDRDSSPVPK